MFRMVAEIKSSDELVRNDELKGKNASDDGGYSEDALVEQPIIREFKKLGYTHLNCFNEKIRLDGKGTLGRKTKSEVLLFWKLREAIQKLNPSICAEAEYAAIKELAKDRSRLTL